MADSPVVTLTTPLGDGVLIFESMTGTERLGQLFRYELFLLSSSSDISFSDLLGQSVTVHVALGDDQFRHFNGYVTEFELVGTSGQNARYRAVLHPWLWFLGLKADCRIFQNMSALDIVTQIFSDISAKEPDLNLDFDDSTSETYQPSEYAVQYRETDLNFVSRLMEREGIYYYFKHDDGDHQLVLADSLSAHSTVPGYESLTYYPPDVHREELEEFVDDWRVTQTVRSGAFAVTDFNFQQTQLQLMATEPNPADHANADFEVYDYPGGYVDRSIGQTYARVRLQEIQTPFARAVGTTNARGLAVGSTFTLDGFPRDDQNGEYLVVSASYTLRGHDVETHSDVPEESVFRCRFGVIESDRPFRAPRSARKPVVEGPQTATVVGPDGKEIWVDEFGRVMVQFPWDRVGKNNEKSSCFVRVSQVWAGSGWGAVFTPRIGQEVIVDFLEGDPDRPIIVGRVHNGSNVPPYKPKTHPTRSGIQSRSSPNGGQANYNEIRFEDLKGHEELYIQAERNQKTHVKHNQSISVGANRSVSVGADESVSIGANQTISVGATRTTTVGKKDTVKLKDEHEITVTKKVTQKYQDDQDLTVTGTQTIEVDKDKTEHVKQTFSLKADTEFKLTQKGDSLLMHDKFELVSAGHISIKNDQCSAMLESGKITLTAATEIMLKCGGASISLKQDGTIEITGAQKVKIGGGAGTVELSAEGAKVSGPKVSISGSAMTEITGALVKIN